MLAALHASIADAAGAWMATPYHRAMPTPDPRITLRVATRADIPAIAAMHLASWQATYASITEPGFMRTVTFQGRVTRWEGAFATETTETRVAVDGPRILGVCSFGPRGEPIDASAGEVYSLHVGPDSLRTGLGRMLLDDALVRLRARGFAEAFLWVLSLNANARAFYASRGWSRRGEERIDERSGFPIAEVRYAIRI